MGTTTLCSLPMSIKTLSVTRSRQAENRGKTDHDVAYGWQHLHSRREHPYADGTCSHHGGVASHLTQ